MKERMKARVGFLRKSANKEPKPKRAKKQKRKRTKKNPPLFFLALVM